MPGDWENVGGTGKMLAERGDALKGSLAREEKIKYDHAGEEGFERLYCLVEQVAGYLVVDIHDFTDLFVAEILKIFEIYDLFLPVGEPVEGV